MVRILSPCRRLRADYGAEPYASYETLVKRELRHIAVAGTSVVHSWSLLARLALKKDYKTLCRLTKRLSEPYYISESRSIAIDWFRAVNLVVFLAVLFVIFTFKKNIDFRLGDAVVETVAASTYLTLGFWAGLATLFFIAPGAHAKAMGLEDTKLMFVLSG